MKWESEHVDPHNNATIKRTAIGKLRADNKLDVDFIGTVPRLAIVNIDNKHQAVLDYR